MAQIKYTQFIGIRTAENGSNGFITNSTSYSMLVVYTNGVYEIVEGDAHAMRPFLPYLKEDNTAQILQESLAELERKLEQMVDTRIERIFAVNHPIPAVAGMLEDEAIAKLKAAGFQVKLVNSYPPDMPKGIVKSCQREHENYLTVLLDVRHELPDVVGLPEDEAVALLERAGFRIVKAYQYPEGTPLGKVYSCKRESETSAEVTLDVRHELPKVEGLPLEEAKALLEQAGFKTEITYCDRFNMDYVVTKVERKGIRKLEVAIVAASRDCNLTGMAVEEAKRLAEKAGVKVTVESINSDEFPAGKVCSWKSVDNGVLLYVSRGSDDWVARDVNCWITPSDGTTVECRRVSASFEWRTMTLVLSAELRHSAKSKYQFTGYGNATIDGNVVLALAAEVRHSEKGKQPFMGYESTTTEGDVTNLYGQQMEAEQWYPVQLYTKTTADQAGKLKKAEYVLYSTYGMFKKEVKWTLIFDIAW